MTFAPILARASALTGVADAAGNADGYDAQIKVGAAGLGRASKKRGAQGDDGAWTPGSAADPSQPTQKKPSTIAGRMSIYMATAAACPCTWRRSAPSHR